MHYYVDGYNLLFRFRQLEGSLQEKREFVIEQLYEKISLLNIDVTLVFDAYYRLGLGSRSHLHFLEICFTESGETADEWILNELLSVRNPREEIVVTSDKQLAWRARRLHAKTETVESFLKWIEKGATKRKKEKKKEKEIRPNLIEVKKESAHSSSSMPSSLEEVDPSLYSYLRIFEANFQKLIEAEPPREKQEPEMDRWLRLFQEKLDNN